MARTILDSEFRNWEVFVNTGPSGFSTPPGIVFRCVSDRETPSRIAPFQGEPNAALALVESGPSDDLLALLEQGKPLS